MFAGRVPLLGVMRISSPPQLGLKRYPWWDPLETAMSEPYRRKRCSPICWMGFLLIVLSIEITQGNAISMAGVLPPWTVERDTDNCALPGKSDYTP